MADRKDIAGSFGVAPAGAPHEVAQPIAPATLEQQLAVARANEKTLPPFNPQPTVPPVEMQSRLSAAVQQRQAERTRSEQPAASETDSPSRGMPQPIADPGKRITGGFGDTLEAQYVPLNGRELLKVVQNLLATLEARLANDLRFHIGLCYPRVRASVIVQIEGYTEAGNFEIPKTFVHEQTPLDVAKRMADEFAFVIRERRQEFTADGQPEDPPDRLRDELGLSKPRKQMVQAGGMRMIVDVPTLGESF